ncbi:2-oxoacid:acceptor oxidoreductase family protein [Thermodesulfobacteriota bacterium]
MEYSDSKRVEVRFAGVGGGGLLTAGKVLAEAAFPTYPFVSWCPSYTIAVRGGGSESTVILSQDEIYSPITEEIEDLVIVTPSKLKHYESGVRSGGVLIVESAGLEQEVERQDVRVVKVPALEIALELGDLRISNFVLLGAYVGTRNPIPAELVEEEIEKTFSGNAKVLHQNKEAFKQGLKFADRI